MSDPAPGRSVESRGGGPEEAGGRDTRSRLVEAAARLFARDGFRRVTVREICGEADANVASVSYYFGDKLGLYREVVRGAIERIQGADPTIEAPAGSSAEARVRHYVRTFLPRLARPAGPAVWMQRIMGHEMQEPTPLAPWIAERVVLPRVRYLADAVAELLGCEPEDPRVRRCVISLQAQCLFYMPNRFRREALPGWREPSDEELARVAEHVAAFSLAGIRHLARRGEADG